MGINFAYFPDTIIYITVNAYYIGYKGSLTKATVKG